MSDFYDDLADTAEELIAEFGGSLILRRINPGAYSASSDSHAGGSTIDRTVAGVVTKFTAKELALEGIERSDKKILLAALAAPQKDDIIIDGSDHYTVIDVETLKPAATTLLFKVQARR